MLADTPSLQELIRRELRGCDLACWCPLTDEAGGRAPCHADVMLDVAAGAAVEFAAADRPRTSG